MPENESQIVSNWFPAWIEWQGPCSVFDLVFFFFFSWLLCLPILFSRLSAGFPIDSSATGGVWWLSYPEGVGWHAVCICDRLKQVQFCFTLLCLFFLDSSIITIHVVCYQVCVKISLCWCVCEVDVARRSALSDPISRPMLWCEGHCQETTTRQRRYSCPQCSFSFATHIHSHS